MRNAVVLALSILVAACSVSHRSQEYACTTQTDCASHPGTICEDGFCVVTSALDAPKSVIDAPRVVVDAPKRPVDAADSCPAVCSSCNMGMGMGNKNCVIDCQTADCSQPIACPVGFKCNVRCNSVAACQQGVSCVDATSCTIECSGIQSCRGITCGSGACDVTCSGLQSCQNVDCGSSCACDVSCTGGGSCGFGQTTCSSPQCAPSFNGDCSSMGNGCNTCQ